MATFEEHVKKLNDKTGFIDLFWPGVLIVEQKSAGRDLEKAKTQALEYCLGLKPTDHPRYLLVSDFRNFELYDLDEREEARFSLAELPHHIDKFNFILGVQKRTFRDQDPVNLIASKLMADIHDALKASGYEGHELELYLVRLIFCLFADDTGIFEPRDILLDLLRDRTREDGSDLGPWLAQLFEVLNKPEDKRQKALDEDLAAFPYVNGDLFAKHLPTAAFDSGMREKLIAAAEFNWDAISPAIFGSLFQEVLNPKERRKKGAHYTTEQNILKLIEPLFLDDLRAEFEKLKNRKDNRRRRELEKFHERLAIMKFFDPACGCGNFLIIAYRELRLLEIALLRELYPDSQLNLDVASLAKLNVDQFYGVELDEFPARIAETALWMMDHIMNNRLSLEFGEAYARIPLKASPHIHHGDALELDWNDVLPAADCSFVFGNPPFAGAKYQSPEQRAQVRAIARLGKSGGTLDYVCAWFIKAGEYVKEASTAPSAVPPPLAGEVSPKAAEGALSIDPPFDPRLTARPTSPASGGSGPPRIGFVATNSITQGEQVAQLWPILFDRCGLEIAFAHRTFAWGSNARGKAHVHVVIIGLTNRAGEPDEKRLFSYDDINGDPVTSRHKALSPYLFDAGGLANRHLVVAETSKSLCGAPKLRSGTQPIDNGHLIFDSQERIEFLKAEPNAEQFMRPFLGAEEYLYSNERWILSLQNASPTDLRKLPQVIERLRSVKVFRKTSKRKSTLAIADTPVQFNVTVIPDRPFLVLPEVSSERRNYVPFGWLEPPVIPSNLVRVMVDATTYDFAILTSAMHMAWLRHIGGRLKSDYRYSIGLVYNTFPWPVASDKQKQKICDLAQAVLDARDGFPDASLADLYDPDVMPAVLRKAHNALDKAVDRLYRRGAFNSDRERAEHLFGLYEKLTAPLDAAAKTKPKRVRRTTKVTPASR